MNSAALEREIALGYVTRRKHPERDLYIYNYTAKAQYDDHWNAVTRACRGLILDGEGKVVARPFEKFFNLTRYAPEELPDEPFEVFEKLDGSLVIAARHEGDLVVATRGSFESDQAGRARRLLDENYDASVLEEGKTYLFEIVYSDNRIVVDYGDAEHLTLLAVRDTQTGAYLLPDKSGLGFPRPVCHDPDCTPHALYERERENAEGFVVVFESGFRTKVKFAEYVRLHRIRTQLSTKSLWRHLRMGEPLEALLAEVPADQRSWAEAEGRKLRDAFATLKELALDEASRYQVGRPLEDAGDRKATALRFREEASLPVGLLFQVLLDRDWEDALWKRTEPAYRTPGGGSQDSTKRSA